MKGRKKYFLSCFSLSSTSCFHDSYVSYTAWCLLWDTWHDILAFSLVWKTYLLNFTVSSWISIFTSPIKASVQFWGHFFSVLPAASYVQGMLKSSFTWKLWVYPMTAINKRKGNWSRYYTPETTANAQVLTWVHSLAIPMLTEGSLYHEM